MLSAVLYVRVVLHNITPTVLEKAILQLPDFKPVDAVVHFVDLSSTSKQECNQSSSDHELALLRNDVKMKQKKGDVAVLSQDELDWSEISDAEISKFTQPDKSVATTDATDLLCDNVRKVDATASDNVKGIEENMVAASVLLDETPVIACRLRKPSAVCESPFLSKFDSGCGKVEGQSSKRVENAQPSKCVLSIKHPFVKSITEQIDDIKVTLKFNRPVYSNSFNALRKYFDYGVDTVKMKEWFFTLAYPGVPLTDSVSNEFVS
ncbi:hypothetical protein FXO38_08938 [Capsicum annuum]|nr:hypothetical protein FXO38_08938 [Capsicum annuum]KAF3674118.1 hypothetical protein FXO37_06596 [Capsicum annuum]